ncbi:MAG TPA: regulatory protein RecX [Rubrobacteraceae bacterium]|nr:regulatory protein RecX [Rubrobacteraceae bacterium]
MPRVTDIRERRGRVRVYVDGEFWAEVDAGTVTERGLYEGAALSHEELHAARDAGERALAMGRALNLVSYRDRSNREIRQRLGRFGYADETVELVVARLEELGYLDDEQYARNLAREKARKYGPRRVYGDLRKGGLDEATAWEVVEEEFSGRSESDEAFEAAARRYNSREGSDAQARRVYGFLMRRGYSAEVCAEVARRYREPSSSGAGE